MSLAQPVTTDKLESYLQSIIFPDLERGRPGFDRPHTENVVRYTKQLLAETDYSQDSTTLLIAAYAHDWGYADLFTSDSLNYQIIQDAKQQHMEVGAKKTKMLLADRYFNWLSQQQKERIIHLVACHDNMQQISAEDEILLMEADSLGSLDLTGITTKLDPASEAQFIAGFYRKRLPKFKHQLAKDQAEKLIVQRTSKLSKLSS